MATQRKIFGRIPTYRGDWSEGVPVKEKFRFTYRGSEFQALRDGLTTPPLNENDELNDGWQTISNGTDAYRSGELLDAYLNDSSTSVEFIRAYIDSDNRLLWGIKADGTIYYGAGIPPQVKRAIDSLIGEVNTLSEEFTQRLNKEIQRVDELGMYTIDADFIRLVIDADGRIIDSMDPNGEVIHNTPHSFTDGVFIKGKDSPVDTESISVSYIPFQEYVSILMDSNGRIIEATLSDGSRYIPSIKSPTIDSLDRRITALEVRKESLPLSVPPAVYTVCNDVVRNVNTAGRNYSQSVFLSHFTKGIKAGEDVYFKNSMREEHRFISPITIIDAASSQATWNSEDSSSDHNIFEKSRIMQIHGGKNYDDASATIKHRSTLNSCTKDIIPRVLCIGDSITFGEGSVMPSDSDNHMGVGSPFKYGAEMPYHLACQKFFTLDNIEAGEPENQYKCIFLGYNKIQKSITHNGVTKTYESFNAGIRGIRTTQYYKPIDDPYPTSGTKYFMGEDGYFSLKAFIEGYRTLSDTGERLQITDPSIGTKITSGNINTFNVCKPTHVLIMLGANDRFNFNIEHYKYIVNKIKEEYPDVIIGCALSDAAGTFFPEAYTDLPFESVFFNNGGANDLHESQYSNMSQIISEYSDSEDEGVYVVPFMFVSPTHNAAWYRKVTAPYEESKILEPYGWGWSVHLNGVAHTHMGYCLYSWLKYTIAKQLLQLNNN